MPRPLTLAIATALAATLSTLCPAPAASAAVTGYTYTGGFDSGPADVTIGFGFYVPESITVTQLGAVDFFGTGLLAATPVGLWTDAGSLLSSTSVPAGTAGELVDGFRFAAITPVTLPGDAVYWIGMQASNAVSVSGVSPTGAPGILILDGGTVTYASAPGTELAFPKVYDQGGSIAAANFRFVVPEPASLTLLGLAGAAMLARRGR